MSVRYLAEGYYRIAPQDVEDDLDQISFLVGSISMIFFCALFSFAGVAAFFVLFE